MIVVRMMHCVFIPMDTLTAFPAIHITMKEMQKKWKTRQKVDTDAKTVFL